MTTSDTHDHCLKLTQRIGEALEVFFRCRWGDVDVTGRSTCAVEHGCIAADQYEVDAVAIEGFDEGAQSADRRRNTTSLESPKAKPARPLTDGCHKGSFMPGQNGANAPDELVQPV